MQEPEVSTGRCGGSRRWTQRGRGVSQHAAWSQRPLCWNVWPDSFNKHYMCSVHLIYHRIHWSEKFTFLPRWRLHKRSSFVFHTQRGLAERLLISQTWKDLRSHWSPHVPLSDRSLDGFLMSYIDPYGAECAAHAATCTPLQTEVELRAGMLLIFLLSFWKRKK